MSRKGGERTPALQDYTVLPTCTNTGVVQWPCLCNHLKGMQFTEIRNGIADSPSFPLKNNDHGWPLWSRELNKSQKKKFCYVQTKLQWKLTFDQDRGKTDIYWSCSWWHPIKWCQSLVSESAPFPCLVQVLWLTHTNHLPGRRVKEIRAWFCCSFSWRSVNLPGSLHLNSNYLKI